MPFFGLFCSSRSSSGIARVEEKSTARISMKSEALMMVLLELTCIYNVNSIIVSSIFLRLSQMQSIRL